MDALAVNVATYSHCGRRRANQDAVEVRRLSTGAELIAVADGMGGHAAGEVASATALEVLAAELERGLPLQAAVVAANQVVFGRAKERKEWSGMGTTLVALLKEADGYVISNVGDSRAYRIENNAIHQITSDHSFVAEAVLSGAMTEAQAEASPWKNALTRAVGTDAEVEVDVFGPFSLTPPHAILLCSDGLYRSVSPEVIREYVLSTADPRTAAEALAALAYRRGSDDNISLALVEFEPLTRRAPTVTLPLAIQLQRKVSNGRKPVPTAITDTVPGPAVEQQRESPVHGRREAIVASSDPGRRRSSWWLPLAVGVVTVLAAAWALMGGAP